MIPTLHDKVEYADSLHFGDTEPDYDADRVYQAILDVGAWYVAHFQRRMQEAGVVAVAKQLKKQGVPLEIAMLIMFGQPPRLLS